MASARIYLDHNATAPLRPEARAAMTSALDLVGNASSVHGEGRRARATIETAREQVAALVGAKPSEVIFTSGATEANATVCAGGKWGSIAASRIEHPSVLQAMPSITMLSIAAGDNGVVAIDDELAGMLGDADRLPAPMLASVQFANGETGVVQDVARFVQICRRVRPDAFVHTDAVQAAGRVTLDFAALGVDAMTVSSHKLGGPQGVGALIIRDGAVLSPLVRGGGQERGWRAGTENVAGIAGFGAASRASQRDLADMPRLRLLRDRLEAGVLDRTPSALVIGEHAGRLPNTSYIAVPGLSAETLVIALDLAGFAVSAGAACSSGKVSTSHVLSAMGFAPDIAGCAIRVSTGWTTTQTDIDAFLAAFRQITQSHLSAHRPARKVA